MRIQRPTDPSWLQVWVVALLGIYFVIGAVAWVIFAYEGRDFPESFGTILATIAGGLVGVLRSPVETGEPSEQQAQRRQPGDDDPAG